ncbi:hypothetical protein BO71DRAFT_432628 [Aspergillus ellipticus CBS 707.79]|uniref:Uncharacterized protein n=1 Tax=Aspergillus ellipticus CBS 707.79 TaxID=1448320 RepID=A0A319DBJ6_9EURO|nr:hypothetical protein BO71DRAFT_432628 [Aspergillus ellipticus CBS 707.79]
MRDRESVETEVPVTNDLARFDLHEFHILPGGETALAVTLRVRDLPLTELGRPMEMSRVATGGVVELNNASDDFTEQEPVSSALVVALDTVHRTATVLQRFARPDGGLSRMRGNFQMLETGQAFVGWSEQGYHSEHAPDGTEAAASPGVLPTVNGAIVGVGLLACLGTGLGMLLRRRLARRSYRYSRLVSPAKGIPLDAERAD